ncbi:MAG: hypothetical protein WBQ73_02510 [Candidatus Babeliales bacterium]
MYKRLLIVLFFSVSLVYPAGFHLKNMQRGLYTIARDSLAGRKFGRRTTSKRSRLFDLKNSFRPVKDRFAEMRRYNKLINRWQDEKEEDSYDHFLSNQLLLQAAAKVFGFFSLLKNYSLYTDSFFLPQMSLRLYLPPFIRWEVR